MIRSLLTILFISIVPILIFQETKGEPRKCYQCNSFYDKGCADFFDNRTYPLIPCKGNETMCRKIIQETWFESKWDVRYIRQCAITGDVGPMDGRWCKERSGGYYTRLKICQCDNKDGCNAAPSLISSYTSTLLMLPALVLTYKNFILTNS